STGRPGPCPGPPEPAATSSKSRAALRSVQFEHVLAAVGGVADEALADRVDDEIEQFQRDLPDEDGAIVRKFRHIDGAVALLNRQTNRAINLEGHNPGARAGRFRAGRTKAELLDQPLRH